MRLCIFLLAALLTCCTPTDLKLSDPSQIAIVGNQTITQADVRARMQELANYKVSRHFGDDEKRNLLQEMIHFALVYQAALKSGAKASDDKNEQKRIVRDYIRKNINDRINASKNDARGIYNKYQVRYDLIQASHILIKTKKRSEEEALELANDLHRRATSGEDFAALAREFSEDKPTKFAGGDLGYFGTEKKFVKEFKDASFALKKVGDISPVIKSQFGYHIILLTDDRRGYEVNEKIILAQLAHNKRKAAFDTLLVELKESTPVVVDFSRLEDVNLSLLDDDNGTS